MNHYLNEIRDLVNKINENHKHHLESVNEPVLIKVVFPDSSSVHVQIDKDGLEFVNPDKEKIIKNQVYLTFKDLKKLIDNPISIVRFITTGRVKIKGNIKEILNILQKI